MKKIPKKLLSVLLAVLMVVSIIPMGMIASNAAQQATSFAPRYKTPGKTGYFANYTRANCTTYAACRANEILKANVFPNTNSSIAVDNFKNYGFPTGTEARVGAIAVWTGKHVAIVEDVNGNTITTSEGHYTQAITDSTFTNIDYNGDGVTDTRKTTNDKTGTYFDNHVGRISYVNGSNPNYYIYLCKEAKKTYDLTPAQATADLNTFYSKNSGLFKSGGCSNLTRNALYYFGIFTSPSLRLGNGNQTLDCFNASYLKSGWKAVRYNGSNCLQQIINDNGGGNVYNIMISYEKTGKPGSKYYNYGHVVFIRAIINGTVYFTDNWKENGSYTHTRTVAQMQSGSFIGNNAAKGAYYFTTDMDFRKLDGGGGEIIDIVTPVPNNYYTPTSTKQIGTYTVNANTNLRTSYGTQNGIVGLVSKGSSIYVYETKGNWGKITYAGKTGWLCLDYSSFVSIPEATTPNVSISTTKIAQGSNITISYSSSNASKYHVYQNGTEVYTGASTSYQANLANAGTYSFYVVAENSAGKRSGNSSTVSCESMPDSTVRFENFDGSLISEAKVKYAHSATAPAAPERKGYNFNGWDKTYSNITADTTITATYIKKIYKVRFYGQKLLETSEPELLSEQNVAFEDSATPPVNTKAYPGYSFRGWNSNKYNEVYTDSADQTINIYGIYEWDNYDLPIILSNVHAIREKDEDGYRVTFDLQNYNVGTTKGRAIITLKTSQGKLISTTESASFKLGKAATKSFDEFVDCESVATVVEVVITNGLSTGVPISENITESVDTSEMWSEWNDTLPQNSDNLEIDQRIVYRSRDKETTTGTSKTIDGWVYDGVASTTVKTGSSYSEISPVNTDALVRTVASPVSVVVGYNQKTQYRYHHWANGSHTECWPYSTSKTPYLHYYGWNDWASTYYTTKYYSADGCNHNVYRENGHNMWCSSCNSSYCCWYDQETRTVDNPNSPIYGNRYDYTETYYTYNFYRWKAWSDWTETPTTASSNTEVEQKPQYRWFTNALSLEDNNGSTRTVSSDIYKKLPECAGKQITLFVYKYGEASDFTDEFVGQTTVAADGSYSFNFKLREEPSIKTGDYTIALGIEGTTELQEIDTIKAPKPTYTVNFYDANGNIISTQHITEGENAEVPELPEKTGYRFLYWNLNNMNLENDASLSNPANVTNIRSNMDIYPAYEREEYTVVFVDWLQQTVETAKIKYGEVITAPEVDAVKGYNFDGWDMLISGNVEATSDMVITAQYSKKVYTIKFVDIDGRTIVSEQKVEYDDSAYIPQYDTDDNVVIYDFLNSDEYVNVDHDAIIYPEYIFDETTPEPTANYETGEYGTALDLTLTSEDENAVIYYSIDNSEEEIEYTGPIHLERTCSVSFHAESFAKNNSATTTNYYCINSGDTPSSWMTYAQLPEAVKQNLSSYTLEDEDGYRYKDTQTTSSFSAYNSLIGSGWTDLSEQTVYSAWQDGALSADTSLINCTVETQEVEDRTVYRYQYSHYKYTENGNVCYAPDVVAGTDGETETVIVDNKLSVAGFLENNTSYYNYNGEQWFNQTKIFGVKTQYRLAYTEKTVYKWTAWDIVAPGSNETRDYENETVYRFYNKDYHIVSVIYEMDEKVQLVEDGKTVDLTALQNVTGYDFVGLYTDYDYSTAWAAATPVTDSIELYASYTPKKYSVTFQMQDGTEIDSQLVDYLDSAVAPDTDSVPGWVFAGWDKPFDSITENTVITGKYVRESEYARISLNLPKVMMYVGNISQLTATISPANLSDEDVFWSSSDLSVATVDENGMVTAVGAGTATIAATAVSSGETANCEVIVSEDFSTRIILTTAAIIGMDSERNVRVTPSNSTTVADIKAQFVNNNLSVYSVDGNELNDDDIVTTGTVIKLMFNGSELDSVTVVYTGDFDCNGIVSTADIIAISQYILQSRTANRYQLTAIDVNGDGFVNNKDCSMLSRYLVGKESL